MTLKIREPNSHFRMHGYNVRVYSHPKAVEEDAGAKSQKPAWRPMSSPKNEGPRSALCTHNVNMDLNALSYANLCKPGEYGNHIFHHICSYYLSPHMPTVKGDRFCCYSWTGNAGALESFRQSCAFRPASTR